MEEGLGSDLKLEDWGESWSMKESKQARQGKISISGRNPQGLHHSQGLIVWKEGKEKRKEEKENLLGESQDFLQ